MLTMILKTHGDGGREAYDHCHDHHHHYEHYNHYDHRHHLPKMICKTQADGVGKLNMIIVMIIIVIVRIIIIMIIIIIIPK